MDPRSEAIKKAGRDGGGPWGGQVSSDLAAALARELRALANPERATHEKSYLKSDLDHFGVPVPDVRDTTRRFLKERVPVEHDATLAFAQAAWTVGVHELRAAAVEVLNARVGLLGSADIQFVERLLREARTWALVDGLAPFVVGSLVARDSSLESTLLSWAVDPDFWLRRAAILAYLVPMRQGEPVFDRFTAIADPLLEDRQFFVRKAIGWVLRERGKKNPDEVYGWLAPRRDRAARLTLREASKYLSHEQRDRLLAAPPG